MVRLLVRGREATKDDHMVLRDLEQATSFKAYPIGVFFYFQVQRFPMVPVFKVKFFNQICSLATIESSHNIEGFVVKSQCCMEVSSSIQIGHLCPCI